MRALESRWEEHIEAVRTSIVLPPEFSNRNKKQNKALLLNKKLWEITSYLGSIRSMKFSKVFFVFLSVLNQIKEFEFIDNNTDPIIQFCIAFADCPVLLTRFIVTNSLFVKQDRFKNMSDSDNDLMLWCRLESSILKLLALDSALMNDCLIFQQQLMDGKYV